MDIESRVQEIGKEIFERSKNVPVSLFDKNYWSGKLLDWSMQHKGFKVDMFRFVDVLPSLQDGEDVADHVQQYFSESSATMPPLIRAGLSVAGSGGIVSKIAAMAIKKNVTSMAELFIAGETITAALPKLEQMWQDKMSATVDILGEAALSEKETAVYQKGYMELIRVLSEIVPSWKATPQLEEAVYGHVPRANISVKCTGLYSQIDGAAFRSTLEGIKNNLRPILLTAKERGVFVNLDMEQNDSRDIIMTVVEELFVEEGLRDYPYLGIVVQTYLKTAEADIDRVIRLGQKRGTPVTIRLVKGAQWDYEVVLARQRHWSIPVFTSKAETDENYERCTEKLLHAYPTIWPAFGSHNVRSLSYALAAAEQKGLPKNAIELQMLYGMAEPFKKALVDMGYRVRNYTPVGELLPGMGYLVRRLLENTSNESFLRATFASNENTDTLLMAPAKKKRVHTEKEKVAEHFANEPFQDFGLEASRKPVEDMLQKFSAELPFEVPAVVNGEVRKNLSWKERYNPSQKNQLITRFASSTPAEADEAMKACMGAMQTWGKTPAAERVAKIRRVGEILRTKKALLTVLMVLEVGKNYKEADADVCEAIDFCFYYASLMEGLAAPKIMGTLPGESNQYLYRPRGPAVVIAPWNFPLAILCGMTIGPLVAGNPVIVKPASVSSAIGHQFFLALQEAGLPKEAIHFLPGDGGVVGRHLVNHPNTHIINFTGSRDVGLSIIQDAAILQPGQKQVKKVLAEMGGKNAIIIDSDADLDEAISGSLQSAFGYQGQKCSAVSRLIVHEKVYDRFTARLVEAMQSMRMGPAEDTASRIGPVIDERAQKRLLDVIERHRAKIVGQLAVPDELKEKGYFVPATIFSESDSQSELAQQEFFGPLVTILKVKDIDEAIRVMNGVDYALTGGMYSRSPVNIAKAREEIEVGNLYINRGITGAYVYRQPFGGFKLSGVGAKAGGPDYLLQFLEPRVITENTMRRGFAPEM